MQYSYNEICMEKSIKKTNIDNSTCQLFYHTIIFPTNAWHQSAGASYSVEFTVWTEPEKNTPPEPFFLSLPLTFMHSLHFLRVWSHDPLLVEKYIHISKKSTMITNIGMKYKLHQVLFNQQISPNQPSSGLSLQQTFNLVHSPTAPWPLWNSRGSKSMAPQTLPSEWRWAKMKTWWFERWDADVSSVPSSLAFIFQCWIPSPSLLLYFGLNWIMVWMCVCVFVVILLCVLRE